MDNVHDMIFVTYGLGDRFDRDKFDAVRNHRGRNKPDGGLWASPIDSEYGWREFCTYECYCEHTLYESSFRFRLTPDAKVYVIDSVRDLVGVPFKIRDPYCYITHLIDFEAMAYNYDAILLTKKGERETRHSGLYFGMDLDTWDCECLLVLKPDCVKPCGW